jgi:phage baseplate assembly protein gpV
VGDTVLILFPQDDPAQGVVLGGLYGVRGAPDSGVKDHAIRRYTMVTPGGQRLRLDDSEETVRIENSKGSYVELAPGKVCVHSATDLDLEAPGQAIVIRGKTIDFQRA